jgi:hypothetical protein
MTAEPTIKSSDFPVTSVPAFWPMALAASLMKRGAELYVKNLKFVEEEIKINAELRPSLATANMVGLTFAPCCCATMASREEFQPSSSRRMRATPR